MLYLVNLIVVNLHYQYNLSMITKKEAIQFAGSVTELAKILGISKAAISQWGEIHHKQEYGKCNLYILNGFFTGKIV